VPGLGEDGQESEPGEEQKRSMQWAAMVHKGSVLQKFSRKR
jgi:hypothetical protein